MCRLSSIQRSGVNYFFIELKIPAWIMKPNIIYKLRESLIMRNILFQIMFEPVFRAEMKFIYGRWLIANLTFRVSFENFSPIFEWYNFITGFYCKDWTVRPLFTICYLIVYSGHFRWRINIRRENFHEFQSIETIFRIDGFFAMYGSNPKKSWENTHIEI